MNNITLKSRVINRYMCNRLECEEECKKESKRTFGERLKENLRAFYPIYDIDNTYGHQTKLDNFSIVGRESHTIASTIM